MVNHGRRGTTLFDCTSLATLDALQTLIRADGDRERTMHTAMRDEALQRGGGEANLSPIARARLHKARAAAVDRSQLLAAELDIAGMGLHDLSVGS